MATADSGDDSAPARQILLSETAKADLDEIWFFIARDHPETADRFIDFLMDEISLLADQPRMGRLREDLQPGLRYFPVRRYLIFYQEIDDSRVSILRVVSAARDQVTLFDDESR